MGHRRRRSETAAPAALPPAVRLLLPALTALLTGFLLAVLAGPAAAAEVPAFTSTPGATTNAGTLSWSGTVPAGATPACELTVPDGAPAPVACTATAGTFSVSVQAAGDGDHILSVRAVWEDPETGTVVSDPVSHTTTVDTVGPAVAVTAEPASPGTDTTPTWALSLEGGAGATCQVTGPGHSPAATPCATEHTADLTAAGEGVYVLTVRAEDAAGNVTVVQGGGYELLLPPDRPTVTGPASPARDPEVAWTFVVPADATATCSLAGPGGSAVAAEPCTSPWTTTLTAGDGAYTASVVLTDTGGSSPAGTAGYTLDTVAPSAPVVSGTSGRTASPSVSWTFDAGDATALCRLSVDGTLGDEAACSSPWTGPLGADGTYRLQVVLVDAAGNRSTTAWSPEVELDRVAPATPSITSAPDSPSNGGPSRSFTWNHTVAEITECRVVSGSTVVEDWAPCAGTVTVDVSTWSDGVYTLEVRSRDDLGNTSGTASSAVELDTSAPLAPGVTAPTGPASTSPWVVTWTGEPGATAECTLRRGSTLLGTASCTSPWSVDLTGQPDGIYALTVVLVDAAGNRSAGSVVSYELDTTAPAAPGLSAPTGPSSSRSWTATWAGEAGASATCVLRRGSTTVWSGPCASPTTLDLAGLPDGTYTLEVRLTDPAGNTGGAATATYQLDTTPPAVPVFSVEPPTSSSRTPTWEFASDPGATLLCRLVGPGGIVLVDGVCSSPLTQNLAGRPDGSYVLTVRARDAVGNVSEPASSTYVLDTEAPSAPSVVSAPSTANDRTPTWQLTGPADATLHCRLVAPGGAVVHDGACSATFVPDLTGGPDGSYALTVTAVDAAGNVSAAVGSSYLLDTLAPADPVFPVEPPTSSSRAPRWELSAEDGALLTCRLRAPGGDVLVTEACAGEWTADLTGLPDGTYTLEVQARDAAGNRSGWATSAYLLDTAAPAAPVLDAPPGPSSSRSWTVTWTGEGGATAACTVLRGGTVVRAETACTDPATLDLSGLPDGTYTVEVRLTDAAGNTGPAGVASYVLDTSAPSAPVLTAPSGPSSSRTWTVSWTGETGSTASCLLRQGSTVVWSGACTSPSALDLSGLPDGTWTVEVRLTDAAGNTGSAATATYLLDSTPPAAPVFTVEPPTSSSLAPRWELTAEAGAVLLCRLVGPGGVVAHDGACTSPFTADLTGQADGTWTLTVRARDAAGNLSAAATSTYLLDTVAPSVPSFTVEPPTSWARSPRWEFGSDAGTTLLCVLTGPGGVLLDGVCSSPFTADLTGLPDGDYVLTVRARDAAGNVSGARSSTFVLDTVAPSVPSFTTQPPATSSDRAPTWTFSGDGASVLECRLYGPSGAFAPWAPCPGTWTADLSGRPDGSYELRVRARDAAGNVSALLVGTYLLDTTPPAAVGVTAPASPGSSRTPRWTFTGEPGSTVQCRVDGGAWTACGGELVLDLTGRADGDVVVEVRAVDAAGNVGPVTTSTYVLDTTAPGVPVYTAVPPTSFDRSPRWSFTADAGTVLLCRLTGPGGTTVFSGTCTSPFTGDLTGRPDGTYTLAVTARDAAGNLSSPATSTFVLDTVAPSAPVLTAPPTPGSTRSPSWGISSSGTNSCRLLGPSGLVADWAACGASYTADLAGRADGTYTLEVRTRDAAGNVSTVSTSSYRLDTAAPPAPAVSAPASPSSGSAPSWTVTATEAGTTASCRVLHDGSVVRDWAACPASTTGTAFVYDLSGRPDGTYRLEVRLTDAAGNTGPVAGAGYVFDTTPPEPVVVTAPASPGSTRSPTWRFSTEPGARLECRIGDTGAYGACPAELTVDLSSATDGTYSVWVRAVDVAGNTGPSTRSTYVLDTRAPTAPVVTAPASPASGTAPSWTWTGEAGATATCELLRDGVRVLTSACSSPWAPSLGADGTYVLTVRLVDAAGNVSAPTSASYVLDTTAPAAPLVAGPSSPNSLTSPTFSFTAESGARTECRLSYAAGGGPVSPVTGWGPCTSPSTWSTTQTGRYLVEVRAIDAAGNVSAVTGYAYEYDPDAPAGLLELVLAPSPSTAALPEWSFAAAAGATATCRLVDPTGRVLLDAACSGTVRPPAALTVDGVYRLTITVTDGVGNVGVNEVLYELDTTGPAAPVVSPRGVQSQDSAVSWSWTGDAAATWQCRLRRDGVVVRDWRTCTPHRQVLRSFGEGAYVLEVRGVDALGNVGPVGRGTYRWDTTAPVAVTLSSSHGSSGTARLVTWTFTPPADAVEVTCGVRRDRVLVQSPVPCAGGSFVMDLRGLAEARYDVVLLLTDGAGNTREVIGSYTLTAVVGPAPGPAPVPPPAPRPRPRPVPEPAPVDSGPAPVLPRPVPAVDDVAPTLPVGGGVRALERADDDSLGTPASSPEEPASGPEGTEGELGEPVRDEGAPVLGLPEGPVSGARAVEALKDVAGETIRRPTLPLALILLVGLFLLVQNRIDRRDPKLAGAAVDEEPELEFRPVRGLVFRPGGAPA